MVQRLRPHTGEPESHSDVAQLRGDEGESYSGIARSRAGEHERPRVA